MYCCGIGLMVLFFFKHKTAYEMRISDWSSDVCSSDLTIFRAPRHPYTLGLLASLPQIDGNRQRLRPIPGNPPDLAKVPPGCPFHPRCQLSHGREKCRTERPALLPVGDGGHRTACHFSDELMEGEAKMPAKEIGRAN